MGTSVQNCFNPYGHGLLYNLLSSKEMYLLSSPEFSPCRDYATYWFSVSA